jgi:hypothetical protein
MTSRGFAGRTHSSGARAAAPRVIVNGGTQAVRSTQTVANPAWDRLALGAAGLPSPAVQRRTNGNQIARASFDVGDKKTHAHAEVDYGDIAMRDLPQLRTAEIEQRFTTWTGQPASAIHARVAALSDAARRWLMFALDLLSENPTAGLDKAAAVERLITYAPRALHAPLADPRGPNYFAFESEALRAAGWFESTLTANLHPPTTKEQEKLDEEYNVGTADTSASTCPATRAKADMLDEKTLKTEVDTIVRDFLTNQEALAKSTKGATESMGNVRPLADLVQAEALSFFKPYIAQSHTRAFQQTFSYSSALKDSTATGVITDDVRRAFLENRAHALADNAHLFTKVHFDARCADDRKILADIIEALWNDSKVRAMIMTLSTWLTFTTTEADSAIVTLNLQRAPKLTACDARWKIVETLCHELMHVYVSEDFYGKANDRALIKEGFPEVLGDELYDHIRSRATYDQKFREQFEIGIPHACTFDEIPESTLGYQEAGESAARIRDTVKDDRFRAAFFLGRGELAGLQAGPP